MALQYMRGSTAAQIISRRIATLSVVASIRAGVTTDNENGIIDVAELSFADPVALGMALIQLPRATARKAGAGDCRRF